MTDILRASVSEVKASNRTFQKRHTALLIILSSLVVALVITFIVLLAISQKHLDTTCNKLQQTGIDTTATVNSINLYQTVSGPPPHSEPTTSITLASHLDLHVTYTTDAGGSYSATIPIDYAKHDDLAALYQTATSNSLSVRYLPSAPTTVRPASEFTNDPSLGLCQSW